jgi:aspartate aminotransferase
LLWSKVPLAPKDPILGVTEAFQADTTAHKINLGVGAYRDDQGKSVVLSAVREAERRLQAADHEYLPIAGLPAFVSGMQRLAFGEDSALLRDERVAGVQALSGTGALRLCADFIKQWYTSNGNSNNKNSPRVYLPNPTWGNHAAIFKAAHLEPATYPYYDAKTKSVDMPGLLDCIDAADEGSVFLLHACAHNPTGCDPNREQLRTISAALKAKKHFIVLDSAYQGFASGNCDEDAFAIRLFAEDGHNMALATSTSKNFGLYGERCGTLSIVTQSPEERACVESQLKMIARPMYSSPPVHGARLVNEILSDPALKTQWFADVNEMAMRIIAMRTALRTELEALDSPHCWHHITQQIGMFAYTGISQEHVKQLRDEHNIYLTSNGRISVAGVTTHNVKRLAQALHTVTKDSSL